MEPEFDQLVEHLAPSIELLKHYKQRISSFAKERQDLLQRLADAEVCCARSTAARCNSNSQHWSTPLPRLMQVQNSELHRLRWQLRTRDEEVQELQKAVADAKLYLLDEREQVLKLQTENDDLKTQEVEDRRRIAHLLALTEPMSHEVRMLRLLLRSTRCNTAAQQQLGLTNRPTLPCLPLCLGACNPLFSSLSFFNFHTAVHILPRW